MDAFALLGIAESSSVEEIRAAWRLKARSCHPDVGGTVQEMQELNQALTVALSRAASPQSIQSHQDRTNDDSMHNQMSDEYVRRRPVQKRSTWARVSRDVSSFTVDCLPVETHEALLLTAAWHGDVVLDESPYLLEAIVRDPYSCWVRFEILPEAGASTVSVSVATASGETPVASDDIRDLFVDSLNQLDWTEIRS
jgi:hypothetical protein